MGRRRTLNGKKAAVIVLVILLSQTDDVLAGGVCVGLLCNDGQCVSRSSFCNGNCDCGDCSDEKVQTCPFYDVPARENSPGLSSGAIVGIVVAAICILLILIGMLIVFLICRIRRDALKNRRNRQGELDPSLIAPGCTLPIDIPIEALAREPPPQYTPRVEVTNNTSFQLNQFNISVLPPPYYGPGTSARTELSYSYESPPKYQSLNDLTNTTDARQQTTGQKSTLNPRRSSIDSFNGVPSMSNILLTSSRSSVMMLNSSQSTSNMDDHSRKNRLMIDSARGDSLDTTSNDVISTSTTDSRFRSRSLSNILTESIEIPQFGLQKAAKVSQNLRFKNSAHPSCSVPSMVLTEGLTQCHMSSNEIGDREASNENWKQKQRRYKKKSGKDKTEVHDMDSKEHSGIKTVSALVSGPSSSCIENRLTRTNRCLSRSLPQLAVLQEESKRWEENGSCEV